MTPADIAAHGRGVAIMKAKGPLIVSLISQAEQLANGKAPPRERFEGIVTIAEKVSQTLTPLTACQQGCSHCCYMAVAVSDIEAEAIGRFLGRTPAVKGTQHEYMESNGKQEFYRGVACTMLTPEGKCSIYPVRPIPCRTHHHLGDTNEACKIYKNIEEMQETISLDLMDISVAGAWINMQAGLGFADIREYFPND